MSKEGTRLASKLVDGTKHRMAREIKVKKANLDIFKPYKDQTVMT